MRRWQSGTSASTTYTKWRWSSDTRLNLATDASRTVMAGLRHRIGLDVGRDPLLVQAGTGNTSLKLKGVLWIKASGKCLARAKLEKIPVPIDLRAARRYLERNQDIAAAYEKPISRGTQTVNRNGKACSAAASRCRSRSLGQHNCLGGPPGCARAVGNEAGGTGLAVDSFRTVRCAAATEVPSCCPSTPRV
jgi:hypothetical protein